MDAPSQLQMKYSDNITNTSGACVRGCHSDGEAITFHSLLTTYTPTEHIFFTATLSFMYKMLTFSKTI